VTAKLYVVICSLADLFQTTRIRVPCVASGSGGDLLCW